MAYHYNDCGGGFSIGRLIESPYNVIMFFGVVGYSVAFIVFAVFLHGILKHRSEPLFRKISIDFVIITFVYILGGSYVLIFGGTVLVRLSGLVYLIIGFLLSYSSNVTTELEGDR